MRRRPLALLFAISVFVAIILSAHAYFALRLVRDTGLAAPWAGLCNSALAIGATLIFAYPVSDRVFGPHVGRIFAWPTMLWLGTMFYLLGGLAASDLGLGLAGLHGEHVARVRAVWVGGLTLAVVLVGVRTALGPTPVKRVEFAIEGWPAALDGYRIVQISDVHIGPTLRHAFARRLVERCNALAADIVAITGDLVDGRVSFVGEHVAPFSELRARDGVYFVTGNHDYYSGADAWVRRVGELGIEVLRNRRIIIERGGERFELAGVDDLSSRSMDPSGGHDLDAALDGWDGRTPLVLLAHDPRTFHQGQRRGVHLQLSGHTHGGQLWPFAWFVRLQTRFVAGTYRHEGSQLYVSRGTGYWGPPMRILAPAEISEIVLRPARAAT